MIHFGVLFDHFTTGFLDALSRVPNEQRPLFNSDIEEECGVFDNFIFGNVMGAWFQHRGFQDVQAWSRDFREWLKKHPNRSGLCQPDDPETRWAQGVPINKLDAREERDPSAMVGDGLDRKGPGESNRVELNPPDAPQEDTPTDIDLKAARQAVRISFGALLLYAGYKVARAVAVSFIATPAAGAASLALP